MLTFISSIDQLLSKFYFLIFLKSFLKFSVYFKVRRRTRRITFEVHTRYFHYPNYQHSQVQRQDCPSTWQELQLYQNSKLSLMALSLNELCRLILEWLDSCISLIDIDLAFKKMGQVLWNKRRTWKPGHAAWQGQRGRVTWPVTGQGF